MKEFQYTVKDACGIHARPAGLLVKTVKGFASSATLEKDGKSCDMRKLMALMGMGVKQGETVTIKVEGDDEEAAADNDGPAGFSRLSMVHKGLLSWGRGLAEVRKCLPGPNICSR